MGLLTLCSVLRGGFLYTMIVKGVGFLLPSSRVPGVCPEGMLLDEIDTCINELGRTVSRPLTPAQNPTAKSRMDGWSAHFSCFFEPGGKLANKRCTMLDKKGAYW